MEYFNLLSLGDYKFRRTNLITAPIILLLDILIYILDLSHLWPFGNIHVLLHFLFLLALTSAAFSKDKIDDERIQKIRYTAFKLTLYYTFLVGGFIIYVLSLLFKENTITTLFILYFLESAILLNLILTFIGIKFDPLWMYKEPTSPKEYTKSMVTIYVSFVILLVISAIIFQFLP